MSNKKPSLAAIPKNQDRDMTVFLQSIKTVIEYLDKNGGGGGGTDTSTITGHVNRINEDQSKDINKTIDDKLDIAIEVGNLLDILNGAITESELFIALGTKIDKITTNETAISAETQQRIAALLATNSGLATETAQRKSADEEVNNTLSTNVSKTASNTAAISAETNTRTTQLSAQSSRIDLVVAKSNSNAALIVDERDARTTADSAQASRLTAVEAKATNAQSRVGTLETTTANNTQSIATTKTELRAEFDTSFKGLVIGGDNIILDSTYRKGAFAYGDANISQGQSVGYETPYVRATSTSSNSAFGFIPHSSVRKIKVLGGEQYTLSFFGQATFDSLNYVYLMSRGSANQGLGAIQMGSGMRNKKTLTFTANQDLDDCYILLAATGQPSGSWFSVGGVQLQKGNKATAWSPSASDFQDAIDVNSAAIDDEKVARATAVGAVASQTKTIQTTVDGQTASIQTNKSSIDGLKLNWSVKVDSNGVIGGIALSGGGSTIDFIVRASTFAVAGPSGSTATPFVVKTVRQTINGQVVEPGVYMEDVFIRNGSIVYSKIGHAAIRTANIQDLAVDTLKIKDNAVTVAGLFFSEQMDIINIAQTEGEIAGITIDPAGGAVAISFGFEYLQVRDYGDRTGATLVLRLKRDSTVLRTFYFKARPDSSRPGFYEKTITKGLSAYATFLDRPPVGNRRYSLTAETENTNETYITLAIEARSLWVSGAKK